MEEVDPMDEERGGDPRLDERPPHGDDLREIPVRPDPTQPGAADRPRPLPGDRGTESGGDEHSGHDPRKRPGG